MSLVSKELGTLSFKVCPTTSFICAKNILENYNENAEKKKKMKNLNQYIGRPKFIQSVISDFDKTAKDNKIDDKYLKEINNSDDPKMQPSKNTSKSTQIAISEDLSVAQYYSQIPDDVKFKYMIRKNTNGYNKIKSILVHPLTAVGIAMWMSPSFGSEVKDVFLRFIDGDANLIKETIQNLNNSTGLVNNIETTTNPETNEVSMLVTTFEKNDYMATIKNRNLKKQIQELIDEKNGIIKKKTDKIDQLLIEMKDDRKKADDDRKKADDDRKKADDDRKKADDERKKQEDRFNDLMNRTSHITDKLDDTNKILVETKDILVKTDTKLDKVLPQRVDIDMTNDPDVPQVYILHDRDANDDEHNLYVIRCKTSGYNNQVKRCREKYDDNIHRIYTIKQPNAFIFWRNIKKKLDANIQKHSKTNWFSLNNMTIKSFKNKLNEYESERLEK